MAKIFGSNYTRKDLERRVGSIDQICGATRETLADGLGKGMDLVSVNTGGGLSYQVLPDRGMGIGAAYYDGMPICWISAAGYVAPWFYDPRGTHWLDSFGGGLLTSCGMSSLGTPSLDDGVEYGLHGRISHIPAEEVAIRRAWVGDEYEVAVSGLVREYSVFQPCLELTRSIGSKLGENVIRIDDRIVNAGFRRAEFMILYHMNIGFPFLSETSELTIDSIDVSPKDARYRGEVGSCGRMLPPTQGYEERVFNHRVNPGSDGMTCVSLVNRDGFGNRFGLRIRYTARILDHFVEWKMLGEGEYVLGLEPGNCFVDGRAASREAGDLAFLEPGEERNIRLSIEVFRD
jgi:hypothetical protein